MKNNRIEDERIVLERRKMQSRAYIWVIYVLAIAIIVQQFFLKAPFAQYAVEFFVLLGCGIYNIVGNYIKGIDIWNPTGESKKKILLNTLVSAVVSVIVLGFLSGMKFENLAACFVIFVVCFFTVQLIMIGLNNKKQRKIEKELDGEENL